MSVLSKVTANLAGTKIGDLLEILASISIKKNPDRKFEFSINLLSCSCKVSEELLKNFSPPYKWISNYFYESVEVGIKSIQPENESKPLYTPFDKILQLEGSWHVDGCGKTEVI